MKFEKLFEPISIGNMRLDNRIAIPPMSSGSTKDGFVTDRMLSFYRDIARSGAGLIITEDSIVDTPIGKHQIEDVSIDDDKYIPGLRRLAQTIKDEGAKAAITLSHAGRMGGRIIRGQLLITKGLIPKAPSPIPTPFPGYVVPEEFTIEEIEEIEDKFALAAWRAKEAGFDAISFHCTHIYLIEQFLSPASNKRQDAYGGDFNRRLRFLFEIIRKSKKLVGDDYPMMCRISGEELWEGGLSVEDARETSRRLEACGVHAISVCLGVNPNVIQPRYIPTLTTSDCMRGRHGALVHLAAAVKDTVSVPVMTANRILTPQHAEQILQQGKADMICIGRGILADMEWVKKAKEEKENEIRLCIGCHEGCSSSMRGQPITCAINPVCNREELEITPAQVKKSVFIAGGGPAGLEAARVAALRGHTVQLYENDKLGGQINLACLTPGKSELKTIIDFELGELHRLGVTIKHEELTIDIIKKEKPDAVIVATGAHPGMPEIPGIENKNVVTAWDVLRRDIVSSAEVIVIGGRQIGAETAEYLAVKGNRVTIVETSDTIAEDIRHVKELYNILQFSLKQLGVKVLTNATVEKIEEKKVIINRKGSKFSSNADMVVIAAGHKADRRLLNQIQKLDIEQYAVGDCAGVGRLVKAINEGFHAGLRL